MRAYDQSGAALSNGSLSNVAYGSQIQNISTSDGSGQIEFVLCTAAFQQQYHAHIQLSDKTTVLRENDTLYGPIDGYNVIGAKSLAGYYFFYLENQAETQATQHLHKTPATSSNNAGSNQQGQNDQQQGQENQQPQTGEGPQQGQENQQPQPNQGTAASSGSGSFSLPKLSKQEMIDLLNSAPTTMPDHVFVSMPSCTAPYATGKVRQNVLDAAAVRLSALRRIAGLPAVTADPTLCEQAQYGAVILGKLGISSHTPNRPADMDQAFYQKAYDAASTSNIYPGMELLNAIDMFMDDSDASNISQVGHRRWQLSTSLGKAGFGYVSTDSGSFTVEKILDQSNPFTDYSYVAWPASGYFPNDLSGFGSDTAWSVSLNPQYYSAPVKTDITVTLTRESDGRQWVLSGRQNYQNANSGRYLNVQPQSWQNYGGNHCIIFRPDGIDKYEGVYNVEINGLKNTNGVAASLSYHVDFFSTKGAVETPTAPTIPTNPTNSTNPTQPTTPTSSINFTDVKSSDWFAPYVNKAAQAGLVSGIGGGKYDPQGNLTVAQAMVLAYQIDSKATGRELPKASGVWYMPYYQYCLDNGIVNRNSFSQASLTRTASRYDMVNILDRSVPASRMTAVKTVTSIPDVPRNGNDIVYKWYQAGILAGDTQGRFNGSSNITRAEVAVILCQINNLT